jgi:integrase/recombinase XerD
MDYITQDQVRSLLRLVPDDRDRCALLVAYLHGLRISEVCALTVEDISGGYLVVRRLKGSNKTTQGLIFSPLDTVLDERSALSDLLRKYKLAPGDRLFPKHISTYWRIMQRAGREAGLPQTVCHPHVLKHSIAMHLVRRISIEQLQCYLGHKSLGSTGVYLHVTDAEASSAVSRIFEGSN